MDLGTLQIPMIFATIFVIASIVLGLIYKFGMKEKTYEEAIAEQRHNTQTLLGIKQKPKEKKSKKASKKAKETEFDNKKKGPDNLEVKLHSKTDKVKSEDSKQKNESKNKTESNKILSKNVDNVSTDTVISSQNLIEEISIIPKKIEQNNSFNKQKSNVVKKEQPKAETIKEKNVPATKKEVSKKEPSIEKQNLDCAEDKQIVNSEVEKSVMKKELMNKVHVEDLKIQKNEEQSIKEVVKQEEQKAPQIKSSKSNIINKNANLKEPTEKVSNSSKAPLNGFLVNPLKDKKKKKEMDALHQLSNLQGEPGVAFILNIISKTELSHSDIQYLINILLNKQLNAPRILEDWSEGKYDPVQRLKKQLAEKEKALIDEKETLASMQTKLKEVRSEQLSERSSLNQKIQILEEQLQNQQMDLLACNSRCHAQGQQLQQTQAQLNEERMKVHSLREELTAMQMQRQQLEMHIAQESEVMIAQLRADIQEYSARNEQMLMDINTIQKDAAENEASYIAQLSNMAQELGEKSRQLEELHIELSNKNEMLYRQEDEFKTEIAQLNAVMQQQAEEIRKTEQSYDENVEEINNLKKQKSISNKVIAQLKSDIEKLQEYKAQQEAAIENNKISETEILNWKNEVVFVKNQSEEKENKLKSEIDSNLNLISKLETELEEQKTKNNDLRNKNYKIMEALNAAEVRIKTVQEENSNIEKTAADQERNNLDAQKKFLARLLPEINGLEDIPSEKWEEECSKLVSNYFEKLKKSATESTENLHAKIEHYQNVIKNNEDMLAKLQVQIEQEQISWKAQLKSKDIELEALKEKYEKSKNVETINGSSFDGQ